MIQVLSDQVQRQILRRNNQHHRNRQHTNRDRHTLPPREPARPNLAQDAYDDLRVIDPHNPRQSVLR